jgi:hypothetical protein
VNGENKAVIIQAKEVKTVHIQKTALEKSKNFQVHSMT